MPFFHGLQLLLLSDSISARIFFSDGVMTLVVKIRR